MGHESLQFTLTNAHVNTIFPSFFFHFMEGMELLTLDLKYCSLCFSSNFLSELGKVEFLLNNLFAAFCCSTRFLIWKFSPATRHHAVNL